jgi:uncharacterized protein
MPTPTIEKLLILQDCDQRRVSLENHVKAVPREVAAVEATIAAEKAAFEAARGELRELEARKKAIENEIGSAQDRMARYKSQQAQVRKNDEYQALGGEIAHAQAEIGGFEEEELKVMYAIDDAKARSAAADAELKRNVAGHEARIQELHERAAALEADLKAAMESVAAARSVLDEPLLRMYDRLVAKPGLPVVVPIHDGMCGGCHLRISFNIDSETRKAGKLVTCDQCTRILYLEA